MFMGVSMNFIVLVSFFSRKYCWGGGIFAIGNFLDGMNRINRIFHHEGTKDTKKVFLDCGDAENDEKRE